MDTEAFSGVMLAPWGWTAIATFAFALAIALVFLRSRRRPGDAPEVPGLPLIGSAVALGHHGVSFVNKCRRKYGDAFTLRLANQKMTFLFDPRHIDTFFSAPDDQITFRPAVEQFTQRVFGLPSRTFFPLHSKMLTDLRHLLVPSVLDTHMKSLGVRVMQLLPLYVHHNQVDLYALCRGLVFHAAVEQLFGGDFVRGLEQGEQGDEQEEEPTSGTGSVEGGMWRRPGAGLQRLAADFFAFEDGFELAASPVPHAFQPAFTAARSGLLRALAAADGRGAFTGTPAGELLDRTSGLPRVLRPNLLLAVLWASQANTVPATFWSLGFLLLPENVVHREEVARELQDEVSKELESPSTTTTAPSDPPTPFSSGMPDTPRGGASSSSFPAPPPPVPVSALVSAAARLAASRRSAASRCVAEAVRLRVQSIDVRIAARDLDLPPCAAAPPGAGESSSSGNGSGSSSGKGGTGEGGGGEGRLLLPRGRILAVCPFESHHDPGLYGSSAWGYDPGRQELRLGAGEGGAVVPSVAGLAFGGGPYRCPGRFFAEQELALLLQLLLAAYPHMQLSYATDVQSPATQQHAVQEELKQGEGQQREGEGKQQGTPGAGSGRRQRRASVLARAAAAAAPPVPPQPQLTEVSGGSFLYGLLCWVAGREGLAWGCGWFDGLDGRMEDWRRSGDPSALLPPCALRRLVGVKVPTLPCWVTLAAHGGEA